MFIDGNQDGVLDTGEPCYTGTASYTITLDTNPPSTFSGCNYSIPNISSGWHDVELSPPSGYTVTGWNQGQGQQGHMGNRASIHCGSPDILNFGIEPVSAPTPTPTPCPGVTCDVNNDGQETEDDYNLIYSCWHQPLSCCPRCDFDCDGNIDIVDIQLFANNCTSLIPTPTPTPTPSVPLDPICNYTGP